MILKGIVYRYRGRYGFRPLSIPEDSFPIDVEVTTLTKSKLLERISLRILSRRLRAVYSYFCACRGYKRRYDIDAFSTDVMALVTINFAQARTLRNSRGWAGERDRGRKDEGREGGEEGETRRATSGPRRGIFFLSRRTKEIIR